MKVHLGLLADVPDEHPEWLWQSRGLWLAKDFPKWMHEKIAIWLATPGFSEYYHIHNLSVSYLQLKRVREALRVHEYEAQGIENLQSVTEEDAIKLFKLRPKRGHIPIACQMHVLNMHKRGMRLCDIGRAFGVSVNYPPFINIIKLGHAYAAQPLPSDLRGIVKQGWLVPKEMKNPYFRKRSESVT